MRKTYKVNAMTRSGLDINNSKQGESIEQKLERMIHNKEKVLPGDGAPLIFTERKEGVKAAYNIRTDRFEIAAEAADNLAKSQIANRANKPGRAPEHIAKGEPTHDKSGTDTNKAN